MRGSGRIGCLVSAALLVGGGYAVVQVAGSEIDFRALRGEVQTQARLARESLDETMVSVISAEAARLGLPQAAGNPTIRRLPGDRIRITVAYPDTVTFLDRWHWVRTRRIDVEQGY
jgi:hypothetical protein